MITTKRSCKLPNNRRTSVSYDKSQEVFVIEAKRLTDKEWIKDVGLAPANTEITEAKQGRVIAKSYLALSTEAAYTVFKELQLLFEDHQEHLREYLTETLNP